VNLAWRARLAGAAAAAVALAAGELVSALSGTGQSLVGGVGNEIVDRAAGGMVRWAIDLFGTANKSALVATIVLVLLLVGAAVGRASLRIAWIGPATFAGVGVVGAIAGLRDPLASDAWVIAASVAAVTAGIATLSVLLRAARGEEILPPSASTTVERPDEGKASRRAFFGWTGAAGAFAAVATLGARSLKQGSAVEAARNEVVLPTVPGELRPTDSLAVEGITPYVVPNDRFYRIDTALIVPQVDISTWKLSINGLVDRPFDLSFDELLALSTTKELVTLSCVSNEVGGTLVGNAEWQGVPLATLLERAGLQADATQLVGKSVDGFTAGFPTELALDGRAALVAVGMNGEPLPVKHGFPARLVVSGVYGYVSATKWLREIHLTGWDDFDGYWIPRGWSKEGPVKTQSRIDVPKSGARIASGPTPIAGVAWAPTKGISKVEVQVDDGEWTTARLGEVTSEHTWVQWMLEWDAPAGDHQIRVRATDGTGETQTDEKSPPAPDGATGWHTRKVAVQ
jgi:DMSO/TMAO reductase YedYZ molybdopterin-dependent catalytic subunit